MGTLRASPSTIPSSWTLWRPMFRRFTSVDLDQRDPGTLHSFAVIPDSDTQTAGVQFNVRLTALDPYKKRRHQLHRGPMCHLQRPRQRPKRNHPRLSGTGDLWSGQLGRHLRQRIRRRRQRAERQALRRRIGRFDRDLDERYPDRLPGHHRESRLGNCRHRAHGDITNTSPALSCTGGVGSLACSSTGESDSSGNVLTAAFQLEDQYGNATINTSRVPS